MRLPAFLSRRRLSSPLWIGTQPGDGSGAVYVAELDPGRGTLGAVRKMAEVEGPSFVLPGTPDVLHVVHECAGGRVSSWKATGVRLKRLAETSSGGDYPCHLAQASGGSMIAVANYGGGVRVIQLGPRGEVTNSDSGASFAASTGTSRPHWVGFRGDVLWVADFGADCLLAFTISGGVAREAGMVRFPQGTGPRTLAWHRRLPQAYVVGERSNTMFHLSLIDTTSAVIRESYPLLPDGFVGVSAAGHAALDRDGARLYASNRGHDSLARFDVDEDGTLSPSGHVASGGAHPRHFAIDPSGRWLVVANRDSNRLSVLELVPDGSLPRLASEVVVRAPSSVTFVLPTQGRRPPEGR